MMVELQSQDHRDLLDVVDSLRSHGVSRYIDLPQIVVCGDQSAGKSSVLEAISGLSFPTKDTLCTRFATELILRRDECPGVQVTIQASNDRSAAEKQKLAQFKYRLDAESPDLAGVTDAAQELMGLSDEKLFSRDILRIELSGPQLPHLTLVDLPGLFRAGNRHQSIDDAPIVSQMVLEYIKKPRCIILAVISAQSDISLQPVLEFTQQADASLERTVGLITKPDTLPKGSESERSFVELAQNNSIVLHLGWHVLRNRAYEERTNTIEQRDDKEREFFNSLPWSQLDSETVGIHQLRPRLSIVLKDQILRHLPSMLQEVSQGIAESEQALRDLGESRALLTEKKRYLRQISSSFSILMNAAVHGHYSSAYFGQASADLGYRKRLRAVIQNELLDFADDMRQQGHAQVIGDITDRIGGKDDSHVSVTRIKREDYYEHVKFVMRRSRGCELPGTFNPMVVQELFREHSEPWEGIVTKAVDAIIQCIRDSTYLAMSSVAANETSNQLKRRTGRAIDNLSSEVRTKINELMHQHRTGHPISYNSTMSEVVQAVQKARPRLFHNDMELSAAELATDYMQAYYSMALNRFVDDVSILAIEQQMMQHLPAVFDTDIVDNLTDSEVETLAAESERTVRERSRHTSRLAALKTACAELQRLEKHQDVAATVSGAYGKAAQDPVSISKSSPSPSSSTELYQLGSPLLDEQPADRDTEPITTWTGLGRDRLDAIVGDEADFSILPRKTKKKSKKQKMETSGLGWAEE